MTTVSAGPAPQSALSRISQMAASAVGAKKKGEDKKDDDKAEDKKDDDKASDKKDDDKAEDKKDDDKAEDKKDDDKADKDKETDDDEPVEKKGKKKSEDSGDDDAKSAKDGDDDSDEDDKGNKDAKAARRRERGRIAAIVTCKSAMHSMSNLSYAVHLACNTSMPRSEAIGLLNHVSKDDPAPAAAERKDPLRERMQDAPKPDIGADASSGKGPTLAAQIVLAGKKRRGEKID